MEIGIETTELKKCSGATLENMSEYKIKNDYTKYNNLIFKGFNSGVVLFHLERLRNSPIYNR